MRKDSSGGLAPVPGYFTSQMLQMENLVTADEMPFFDIVEYGRFVSCAIQACCWFFTLKSTHPCCFHTYGQ